MLDDTLDLAQLAEEFLAIWARFEPEWALTRVLTTGHPVHLAGLDYDDDGALHSVLSSLLSALEELDETTLEPWPRATYEWLYRLAQCECRALFDPALRLRDPLYKLPLGAFLMASRAVGRGREAAWLNLLEQIPAQLLGLRRQWRESCRFVVPALAEQAMAQLSVAIQVLNQLGRRDWVHWESAPPLLDQLEEAARDLRQCLKNDVLPMAGGTPGLGAAAYRELLTQRYRLSLDLDGLLVALTNEQTLRWTALCTERDETQRLTAWHQHQDLILQHQNSATDPDHTNPLAEKLGILHIMGREVQERLTRASLLDPTAVSPGLIPLGFADWPGPPLTGYLPISATLTGSEKPRCFVDTEETFRSPAHVRRTLLSEVWGGAHGLLPAELSHWPALLNPEFLAAWGLGMRVLWVERGLGDESDRQLLQADRLATCERALLDLRLHLGLTTWEVSQQEHPSVTPAERLTTLRHPGRHLAAWLNGRVLETWFQEQDATGIGGNFPAFQAHWAPAGLMSFPLWLRLEKGSDTLENWLAQAIRTEGLPPSDIH